MDRPITIDITSNMYPEQREFVRDIFSGDYYKVSANAGRRAGKSYAIDRVAIGLCLRESKVEVLWTTPSHSQSQEAFDRILDILTSSGIPFKSTNSTADRKTVFDNGSKIKFRSAEKFDNLRGNNPDYVILDEFAFFKEGAWTLVIEPYAISNDKLVFIAVSTFCGRDNDFYKFYKDGLDVTKKNVKVHKFHYSMNPMTNYEFIDEKRATLPKAVFDQEYEGILVDGVSTVFGDFSRHQTIRVFNPDYTKKCYFGLDCSGKGKDSTVLTLMNTEGRVVDIFKTTTLELFDQSNELIEYLKNYSDVSGYVEANSMGEHFVEALSRAGISAMSWNTSNKSKGKMVTGLILSMNKDEVKLPTSKLCPTLADEMSKYMMFRTPKNGLITYSHPGGGHDDYVDSLMMANEFRISMGNSFTVVDTDYDLLKVMGLYDEEDEDDEY